MAEQEALQCVVKTAGRIVETSLPEISTVYSIPPAACFQCIINVIIDQSLPTLHLFQLLPSRGSYRSIQARTTRVANSLYPKAIKLHFRPTPPT